MTPELFALKHDVATLKEWRDAQRLSQEEAGRVLGISAPSYGRLEMGKLFVKGKKAKRIHEVTGVPLAILVGAA